MTGIEKKVNSQQEKIDYLDEMRHGKGGLLTLEAVERKFSAENTPTDKQEMILKALKDRNETDKFISEVTENEKENDPNRQKLLKERGVEVIEAMDKQIKDGKYSQAASATIWKELNKTSEDHKTKKE